MISNLKNLVYNLDKFNNSYSNTVKLKQNDIRTLEIHVYENGEALDLTGYTAVVKWVNANNTVAPLTTSNIEIKNNTIFVKMIADCTRSAGVAKWELVLSKNDSIDYSFTQEIKILSSVEQGQEESKNVSTLLEDVTKAQEEATKFMNTYGNLYGIKDKVDELNNTKITKNTGAVTMSDLSQDVKEAMTGGSVAVVGNDCVDYGNLTNNLRDILFNYKKEFSLAESSKASNSSTSKYAFFHNKKINYNDIVKYVEFDSPGVVGTTLNILIATKDEDDNFKIIKSIPHTITETGIQKISINSYIGTDYYIGVHSINGGIITYNITGGIGAYIGKIENLNVNNSYNINCFNSYDLRMKVVCYNITKDKTDGLNYACFGDSITSNQVSGIGTIINSLLGTKMIGNFACGFATCSDWHTTVGSDDDAETNTTTITLEVPQNTNTNDNVLSNQVRRMLQHTTPLNQQIKWTHPIDGEFSIDTSIGTGLGHTEDIPDIIYIAIGINDGNKGDNHVRDTVNSVVTQDYKDLTRNSMASALRWAIETLQSAYPNSQIFVATPLQTASNAANMLYSSVKLKNDIIKRICAFCCVPVIDSTYESGFSKIVATNHGPLHPDNEWKQKIAKFVANEIKNKYVLR